LPSPIRKRLFKTSELFWKNKAKTSLLASGGAIVGKRADYKPRRFVRQAGIVISDRLSVHCLRKSYGTNLANLGTPVHTLKELMGHSSITTTMKFYIFVSDANKKKAVEGLEGLMEEVLS
jgi:site-specific recombinase XerD